MTAQAAMNETGQEVVAASDDVKKGLSEIRTTVLGGQILLGFQYEALFQPRFAELSTLSRALAAGGLALMLAAVITMIAPASFHQLAERGERSPRQARAIRLMMMLSLGPFALSAGMTVFVTAGLAMGQTLGIGLGAVVVGLAFCLWYGVEIMAKAPPARIEHPHPTALKDQISDLMTETRIVLPGVQALLGIQFLAYLTETFRKIPPEAKAAHTVALLALLCGMILLMTPPPFHRLAEDGRETTRLRTLSRICILAALAALSIGFSADLFVALRIVTGDVDAAIGGAVAACLLALGVWFALPLALRRRGR